MIAGARTEKYGGSRIGGLTRRKTSGEKESVIIISAMKVQNFIVICKNIYDKAVFIIFFAQGYFFIRIHGFLFHRKPYHQKVGGSKFEVAGFLAGCRHLMRTLNI